MAMWQCMYMVDQQGGGALEGRHIWRRLAVPADCNLLELHVALQNAFDWEDTHLHDFNQPVGMELLGGITLPPFVAHGPTDISAYAQHMVDVEALPHNDVRTFKTVVGAKEDPSDDLLLSKAEDPSESEGAKNCLVYVEHSHPHQEPEDGSALRTPNLASGPSQVSLPLAHPPSPVGRLRSACRWHTTGSQSRPGPRDILTTPSPQAFGCIQASSPCEGCIKEHSGWCVCRTRKGLCVGGTLAW